MKKSSGLLIAAGILVVGVGGCIVGCQLYQDLQSKQTYEEIETTYVTETGDVWYDAMTVDFAGLKQTNSDVIGWLYLDGSDVISYPILQGEDDNEYLHKDLLGQELKAGSIFLEAGNASDFSDYHTIIYGHNMRDGSMFGSLKKYHSEEGFYEEHPYFTVFTPSAAYHYEIFGYEDVSATDQVYTIGYGPGEAYSDFLGYLKSKSYQDSGVDVSDEDRVITLSTCSTSGRRFVVHGVLKDTHVY
ncbi:MAG: class B sortase [Lachnospiraceae bacterium]|nr:class B sortase [Lachnospiraceae bacterium]